MLNRFASLATAFCVMALLLTGCATKKSPISTSDTELQSTLESHPWTLTLPESEVFDGRSLVLLPHRYFFFSEEGSVIDQGYVQIHPTNQTFSLWNTQGHIQFALTHVTPQELSGHVTLFSRLLTQKFEPLATLTPAHTSFSVPTPKTIHEAAQWGDTAAVERFVKDGTDINTVDNTGVTPLMYASYQFHPDTAHFILQNGGDVQRVSSNGKNALLLACEVGNEETARALISHEGVDVNSRTKTGRTPLHLAVENNALALVEALLLAKANINVQDQYGSTPLIMAVSSHKVEDGEIEDNLPLVRLLVEHGADLHLKDQAKGSAVEWAIDLHLLETTKYLLSKDPNLHEETFQQDLRKHLQNKDIPQAFRDQVETMLR